MRFHRQDRDIWTPTVFRALRLLEIIVMSCRVAFICLGVLFKAREREWLIKSEVPSTTAQLRLCLEVRISFGASCSFILVLTR